MINIVSVGAFKTSGALGVYGVHDLLLTGDPLWWTKVAGISAAGRNVRSIAGVR